MGKFKRKDENQPCKHKNQFCNYNGRFKRKNNIPLCKFNIKFKRKDGRQLCKYGYKPQKQYSNYQNLIYKLSHKFHRTTRIETDKLISCANLEFIRCQNNYNPTKSKFSTYLYIKIRGLFLEMNRKKNNNPITTNAYEQKSNNTSDEYLFFKEILKELSTDAKVVCGIVFNTPIDLIKMLPVKQPRGINKHQIQKHLRRQGWTFYRIWKVFREIKESLI